MALQSTSGGRPAITTGTPNDAQDPRIVAGPWMWTITNAPAVAVRAVATKALAAGLRHVLCGFGWLVSPNAGVTANTRVQIRDGATGAGTILMEFTLAAVGQIYSISGLHIPGTVGTAMTIEFDTAPVAATGYQSVNLWGYSVTA